MKFYRAIIIFLVSGLFLFSAYIALLYYESGKGETPVLVKVRPGDSFADIKSRLERKGVLEHPDIFRWAAYLMNKERKIRVGEYRFAGSESVSSILAKLTGGVVEYRKVVIPEGLLLTEIASVVARETGIDSVRFMKLASNRTFIDSLGFDTKTLEGYLFPDTYLVTWPFIGRGIIGQMAQRFRDVYAREASAAADSADMTRREVVTLASIIQAEARGTEEMPKISAVYHNRLGKGMRLEADPTVAYALGGVRRKLWYKDLEVDSPYNTYRYRGLPPGPICSPGREALSAAVRPEPGFDAYYFVADGTGGHVFSRTLSQHNRARRKIKRGEFDGGGRTE
ncbi:MAG: endolytic transglycosylase MltG [Candidatus Latescibacteria bacterium]|nr:endolytic transglycosylase MltG [bacterium]MBD3424844.1 endolytic transglycosylase MltG [Candidatus Latescibacterota bacterium]